MKKLFIVFVMFLILLLGYSYYSKNNIQNKGLTTNEEITEQDEEEIVEVTEDPYCEDYFLLEGDSHIATKEDLGLNLIDDNRYSFTYNGEQFYAIYSPDNWAIIDSYKINNKNDMKIIVETLIDIHPIPGKDKVSYRTVEDMVYEWQIHNFVYDMFYDYEQISHSAKDVDFDPDDQGKTLEDFFKDKTGIDYRKIYSGN